LSGFRICIDQRAANRCDFVAHISLLFPLQRVESRGRRIDVVDHGVDCESVAPIAVRNSNWSLSAAGSIARQRRVALLRRFGERDEASFEGSLRARSGLTASHLAPRSGRAVQMLNATHSTSDRAG